ncbi:LCP family protein [Thalassobacillus pellis]|uniref:LCP family protein n=1 Tax=Thalassobacillus pellis TaxID=748008 RepID=UPI00195F2617|nr:LCP family protein [Thalassobacillus pellis]MBM7551445.1 LCP family protein required for cell wall assembly [Thalassobacillus pellis]
MKYKKIKMTGLAFLLVIFTGVGAAAGYALFLTDKAKQAATESRMELERGEKSDKRKNAVHPEYDNISVLFVGVDNSDTRDKEGNALADALILATFNEDNKSVKLVSIPRDSLVKIPEVGYRDKITHAHAYGGIDATVKTVEKLFDIPVDYYVRVNFNSFTEIVNALGGIKYNVPYDLTEQNSEDTAGAIELEKGYQRLNGEEALALARTRQYDSDLARGQRQMNLLKAIIEKAKKPGAISDYAEIIDSISENMKTNLTFEEMVAFKDYFLNKDSLEFEEMQLKGEGMILESGWYYSVNESSLKNIKQELKSHLDITTKSYANENKQNVEENASGKADSF